MINISLQNGVQFSSKCWYSKQYTRPTSSKGCSSLIQLTLVSDIHHQLNVNKKYEHLARIREDVNSGNGFKKTYGYECLTTQDQLMSKRKEFWCKCKFIQKPELTVHHSAGEQQNQQSNSQIVNKHQFRGDRNEDSQIVAYLHAEQQCSNVPVFCINEPITFAQETIAEKNLNFAYSDQNVQVKIRSVRWPTEDITLTLKLSSTVEDSKKSLRQQKQIPDTEVIRFFYNGRQMIDNKTIGNYSYTMGTIIQAMIR